MGGGAGQRDIVIVRRSNEAVYVNLDTNVVYGGEAQSDRIVRFEEVRGGRHDDTLIGDDQDNCILGWEGTDSLDGGASKKALHRLGYVHASRVRPLPGDTFPPALPGALR